MIKIRAEMNKITRTNKFSKVALYKCTKTNWQ